VADDLDGMVGVLRNAVNRSDIVLITGGLGPTLDDLTRQALAELAQVDLVLDEYWLEYIKSIFARRNRPMPERNVQQAMFPRGSEPLPNLLGTAPGIWMELPRKTSPVLCQIAAMPGVPSEMKPMFVQHVLERFKGSGGCIRRACINCFGAGESQVEEMLGELTARGGDPDIGITAHEGTITLRITAAGNSPLECDQKIAAARLVILNRMGPLVFGEEDEDLQHAVVRLLRQQRRTLSTAESGTGGLVADRLTATPGSEHCYLGGIVASSNTARRELLDVDPALLISPGPNSAAVAEAMAAGCLRRFGSDYALAVSEAPHFEADANTGRAPTSFIALAGPDLVQVEEITHFGDPTIVRSRTAKAVLNLLRLHLVR
jgi:nicotinamide-nucleotide amidase